MSGDVMAQHVGMLISTRARGRICPLRGEAGRRNQGRCSMDGWMQQLIPWTTENPQPGWLRMFWTIWWMWGSKKVLEAGERERKN